MGFVETAGTALLLALVGLLGLLSLLAYFIPSFVAISRDHPNKIAIVELNLFLGWTTVGWAVALFWALSQKK